MQFPDGRTLSSNRRAGLGDDVRHRRAGDRAGVLGARRAPLDYIASRMAISITSAARASVFRDFRPFEVWEGVPVPPHAPTRALRALADEAGTSGERCSRPKVSSFGEVELVVHHPPRPDWERQRVRNDDSEVLEIRYGGVSFVLTGDIGREVERTIASTFDPRADPDPQGRRTTAAPPRARGVPRTLRPDIAVISAGRGNPFGHPVPSVLERCRTSAQRYTGRIGTGR